MSRGILLFTDFHANIWSEFSKPTEEYVNDRFKLQIEVLNNMLKDAQDKNLDVLFAGDLFHKRGAVDVRVYNAVFQTFTSYPSIEHIYLIRGNHDSYNNSLETVSSLDMFNVLPNVQVITKPTVLAEEGRPTFYFMPYGEDTDYMLSLMHKWSKRAQASKTLSIFSGHIGINGAKQGATMHRLASTFGAKDINCKAYDLVYLGHYHYRQEIYNDEQGYVYGNADNDVPNHAQYKNEALYGGSTIPVSFSDEGQIKGYDIYYYKTKERVFVSVEAPRFITLHEWNKDLAEKYKNDYIRLQLPEKQAKEASVATKDTSSVRVEVKADYKTDLRIPIEASDSPYKITSEYTSKMYPKLKEKALECIKEVTND